MTSFPLSAAAAAASSSSAIAASASYNILDADHGVVSQLVSGFLELNESMFLSRLTRIQQHRFSQFHEIREIAIPDKKVSILLSRSNRFHHLEILRVIEGRATQHPPPALNQSQPPCSKLTKFDIMPARGNATLPLPVLLQTLQHSQIWQSVNLRCHPISNKILTELVRSPNLNHLNLGGILFRDDIDYQILAHCQSLTSFIPRKGCPAEALIAIVRANREITELDLSYLSKESYTDEVLSTIAQYLPNLRKIKLPDSIKFTEVSFLPFAQRCTHLQSLTLGYLCVAALKEIGRFQELTDLSLKLAQIPGQEAEVRKGLDAISTINGLTSLHVPLAQGLTDDDLIPVVSRLTKLESLVLCKAPTLDEFDDLIPRSTALVRAVLTHCPKLGELKIFDSIHTMEKLEEIAAAIREGRTALKTVGIFFSRTSEERENLVSALAADGFELHITYPGMSE